MSAPAAGRVYAHARQPLDQTRYDLLIVGAGRLGLACAFYARLFMPEVRVLIVERGGIPNEAGATIHAPGSWQRHGLAPEWQARAAWTRHVWANPEVETGTARPHEVPFTGSGWARLLSAPDDHAPDPGVLDLTPEAFLNGLTPEARAQVETLFDVPSVTGVQLDPLGGYGSASGLALSYGNAAVRLGADLLLNTEARLIPGGLIARRLTVTNTHQVVVDHETEVCAAHLIVAAGAEGPGLLEEELGLVTGHGRAYMQYPQLRLPPAPGLPLLSAGGFTLRPRGDHFSVVPPALPPDPHGYAPAPGRLAGVQVGARRELVEQLLGALEAIPALAGAGLDLGRAETDVPGAWQARPLGGWPLWQTVSEGVHLLLGGPENDRVGLSVALDLAGHLARLNTRPWHDPDTYRVKVEEAAG